MENEEGFIAEDDDRRRSSGANADEDARRRCSPTGLIAEDDDRRRCSPVLDCDAVDEDLFRLFSAAEDAFAALLFADLLLSLLVFPISFLLMKYL